MTRDRYVRAGAVPLSGRAWSGRAPVTRVEVSTDGGASWADARLAPPDAEHPFAWRAWTFPWEARPGLGGLHGWATDDLGAQPGAQGWNRQGMANSLVQRVRVTVLD